MRRRLFVLISCFMAALLVAPLSFAIRRPSEARAAGASSGRALTAATAAQDINGDLNTLAGSGRAEAGVAFAQVKSEVNKSAVTSEPREPSEQMKERLAEMEAEQEEFSPEASLQQGPLAPEGALSPPTEAAGGDHAGPLAPNDLTIFRSHNLSSSEAPTGFRSVVHEPTAINLDSAAFYTANWYAAKSSNGGSSFTYVDPFNFFPSVNGGFCCDQVTAYAPTQDMALWGLQYIKDSNTGTFRLARAVGSTGIANNNWVYWDFTPQNVGFANGNWFDYPSMTVAGSYVYITSNVYRTSDDGFTGSVLMRIPLSSLAAGTSLNYSYFSSTSLGTIRCAEGSGTTLYFAAFSNTTQMRIHRWEESGSGVLWDDVQLNSFTPLNRDGVATSPDGTNWAARADFRPLAAYVAGGVIGVMFMAKQDANFPYPYAIHARFSESTRALVSQGQIWNSKYAWLYPSAMPNASGQLAGTLQIGGGAAADGFPYPGTQIWISDDVQPGGTTVGGVYSLANSDAGPSSNKWGDYFGTRLHKVFTNTWVIASHTLQGGQTSVVPNYTWFGREKNGPGTICPPSSSISYGQTVNGTLASTDCLLDGGKYYDAYTFSGTAGQQIAVSMSSSAFDTFLYLLSPTGSLVASDDDGGGGVNSRIPPGSGYLTLPSTGTYTIRASSFAEGATGSYSLTLTLNPQSSAGLQYFPLAAPVRLLDTRPGAPACDAPGAPLAAGVARSEAARIACTGIPASAQAVVGNATVVNNTGAAGGFVTLYPAGASRPNVSNLNYTTGQVVPNAFTVGLGSTGAFNVYAQTGVHFIVDVTGYYAPAAAGGRYFHLLPSPVRLLDTRAGLPACQNTSAPLAGGAARTQNARLTCGGVIIPSTAQAVVGNATVVNNTGAAGGFVTLYSSGVSRPNVSNLNYATGQVVPNAFTVSLGSDGAFNIYPQTTINFIVDIVGYFSDQQTDANGTGLLYNALAAPVRLLDTRAGLPACDSPGAPLTAGVARTEAARITCTGIPVSALSVVGNATVVNDTGAAGSFVTLYASGAARPGVSNLNYTTGQVVPNAFTVGLGGDGAFNIYAQTGINFIADVSGYYAP
jgi:hypothetical protein